MMIRMRGEGRIQDKVRRRRRCCWGMRKEKDYATPAVVRMYCVRTVRTSIAISLNIEGAEAAFTLSWL
jgi:hypothetical protein